MKLRSPSLGVGRWALGVGRFLLAGFVCIAPPLIAQEVASIGYGPPTSVPMRSTISRATLPPRNWIDQTQAEAEAKSIGCLECHRGVEPMHKATDNVVLGCTDCH